MGITNVTLPARSMRKKALGANGASDVSVSRISPRVGRPKPSNRPPPMALVAVRKCRRFISRLRFRDAGSLLDGSANTRIGAAAADVAGHGAVDVGIARLGVCGEPDHSASPIVAGDVRTRAHRRSFAGRAKGHRTARSRLSRPSERTPVPFVRYRYRRRPK